MNNIYLPIETLKRELHSRAVFATRLAMKNKRVFIFEHTFFDRIGWPGEGIYIGKNCFRTEIPHSLEYYNKMKESNIDVWFLDEEGGIYHGDSQDEWNDRLKNRYDFTKLNSNDKIFFWGNWQKEYYDNKNLPSKAYITGSPNFDIFQKKYSKVFKKYDLKVTGGKKNYILINTRFPIGNSRLGENFALNNPAYSKHHKKNEIINWYTENNVMLFSLIRMTRELARMNPQELFIIRPHPLEKTHIYHLLLNDLDNVSIVDDESSIEPWVRLCRVLIHNGCTTAIQAMIADKKVISYVPKIFQCNISPGLPNTIGYQAKNEDDVNNYLHSADKFEFNNKWQDTISRLDSIEYIMRIIENEKLDHQNNYKLNIPINEYIKDFIEKVSYRLFNYSVRYKYTDMNRMSELIELVSIVNDYYGSKIKCSKIAASCYILEDKT